jgi:CBS domain-containing protein
MIRGLYKTDVCTITSDQSIKDAACLMRDRNIGDVVVVDAKAKGGKPVPLGVLTDRDIVVNCLTGDKQDLANVKVADVMSKSVACVTEDTGLFETIKQMRSAGVGRILVVDNQKCLIGILTAQTIFDLLNDELHELGQIAKSKRANVQGQMAYSGSNVNQTQNQPGMPH